MISTVDLDAEDLEGVAGAIAMPNCRPTVTQGPSAVGDATVGMLPYSVNIVIRSDK